MKMRIVCSSAKRHDDARLLTATISLLELALENLDHLEEGLAAARLSSVLDILKPKS